MPICENCGGAGGHKGWCRGSQPVPLTLRMVIDELDSVTVTFDLADAAQPHSLILPREEWEQLGRPAFLNVSLVTA